VTEVAQAQISEDDGKRANFHVSRSRRNCVYKGKTHPSGVSACRPARSLALDD
jgi:hypothetical protein